MIGRGSDSDYPRYYHELDLGPHPALFAATISNPNDNCTEIQDYYLQCNTLGMAWEAHQGNTLLNKDGWWAVMIISFDFLASVPAQSDSLRQSHHEIRSNRGTYLATTWRANFYRVDSPKDSGRLEYSSWQPTDMVPPCFHVPSKFGVLNITN
ncbi:uncharacterized protein LOC134179803 [Corticium candelabrum]|uniref:uncharacterized protein LOC134179803 n=1 Tax=Corticium candelabrum TaxID=121492 RepID=UPI002E252DB1|nr:uncharacterized protein LOC134179803 [Corticium candelabrum]